MIVEVLYICDDNDNIGIDSDDDDNNSNIIINN